MIRLKTLLGAAGLLALSACAEILDVKNDNNPETDRVLSSPSDVESLIRGAYVQALTPMLSADGINMQLGAVAFENSQTAANFGMIERSAFPRAAIINTTSNQFSGEYYEVWAGEYAAIRSASDGLAKLADADFTLGSAVTDARAEAFGKFVLFLAHATLAVTYDSASVYDETVSAATQVPLAHYSAVMAAALGYANQAITIANANPTIDFPADWFGVGVNATRFVQIVNSLKARYRVQVARTPAETIDWSAVITEANAGITTDLAIVDDDDKWDFWMHDYMSFRGAWHQVPYFLHGMADQSGAYQTWMSTPLDSRTAFVIVTPDRRFPQGGTLAAQQAAGAAGNNIRAKTNATGEGGWLRAERGTWRWSHYLDKRYQNYYDATNTGVALPQIQVKEVQLIKAEALWRRNTGTDRADALAIVNGYRTTDGGLTPATLLGATTGDCVPKLPNGTCGDFMEVLKWEKRMIFFMTVYGGFYFDSRRWGDLAQGTFLSYPVPARELEVRQLALYTHGGAAAAGNATAPVGTYGY